MAYSTPQRSDGRSTSPTKSHTWPGKQVPYVIDRSLYEVTDLILSAMNEFHKKTCIRFKPRINEKDYIYITADEGCSSYVGRKGGRQIVSLGKGCHQKGTIMHELGHVLGFPHEQARPDRDKHVKIIPDNIEADKRYNFSKIPGNKYDLDLLKEPYDEHSIMHYGGDEFAINKSKPTMKTTSGIPLKNPREKSHLSAGDQKKINKIYKC